MSEARKLLIVDYNLTRVHDVRMMAGYARERYGLETILIRSCPGPVDRELADRVIDLDPLDDDFVEKALRALEPWIRDIAAVLPFSDNSVWSGARLAERLGLPGDSAFLADGAFSKIRYRERERDFSQYFGEQGVFTPRFRKVGSLGEIEDFAAGCAAGFVLKPSCEGNNRGVIRIAPGTPLEPAFEEVRRYLSGGLVCEELIDFEEEYSFDGVGHLAFLTEKRSKSSRYPVENGQIVPARAERGRAASIRRAGTLANIIVGQKVGPFHNEIKYDPVSGRSAVIEPNRRPAGMKIWHLAGKVYGVNLFHLWVDQLMGTPLPAVLPAQRGIAAIRELPAPRSGKLSPRLDSAIEQESLFGRILARLGALSKDIEWSDFRVTARGGEVVQPEPKDNSGFIGEVCMFSPRVDCDVDRVMDAFEAAWNEEIGAYL